MTAPSRSPGGDKSKRQKVQVALIYCTSALCGTGKPTSKSLSWRACGLGRRLKPGLLFSTWAIQRCARDSTRWEDKRGASPGAAILLDETRCKTFVI